ncbi:MAG: hypothetical protein H7282_04490 [Cytophagaceae bacterium]|nr:hypothetical protein [Cytophagaceae bacterium]
MAAIESRLKKQLAKNDMSRGRLILPLPNEDKLRRDTTSVIQYSVEQNCRACLDAFLAQRDKLEPYMNVQEELNKSLVFAIKNNNMNMFDYLIQQQHVDINYQCRSCYSRSPLLMALSFKRYNFFFKLIDLGADPHVIDIDGRNAFHNLFVFYKKHEDVSDNNLATRTATIKEIIDTLAAKKVSLQHKDNKGLSPLIVAGGTDDAEVFYHLKSKGVTIQLDNKVEVVSLLNHILFCHPDQLHPPDPAFFEKVVADYQIPLTKELFDTPDLLKLHTITNIVYGNTNRKLFDLLMKLKVNVNVTSDGFDTPINLAILNRSYYMCDGLLSAGVKLDEHTKNYRKRFSDNPQLLKKFKLVCASN